MGAREFAFLMGSWVCWCCWPRDHPLKTTEFAIIVAVLLVEYWPSYSLPWTMLSSLYELFYLPFNNLMKCKLLSQFYKWGIEGVTLLNTWPQCRKWQAGLRCELISNSGAPGYRHDDRQHSLCVLSKYLTMCRPVIPQTDAQSYLPLDSYQTPALLEQGPDHPCSFFPFLYLEPRNKLSHSKCTINWYLFKN